LFLFYPEGGDLNGVCKKNSQEKNGKKDRKENSKKDSEKKEEVV